MLLPLTLAAIVVSLLLAFGIFAVVELRRAKGLECDP